MRSLTPLTMIPTRTLTFFNSSFGDRELLASVSLVSLRGELGNWKYNTFSVVEDSIMLWWHSGTQKRRGRTKQRDQIDNEARFFWKSTVKTKHESLTSLAFIRLVPGADRAVRHICIRCMVVEKPDKGLHGFQGVFIANVFSVLAVHIEKNYNWVKEEHTPKTALTLVALVRDVLLPSSMNARSLAIKLFKLFTSGE